MSIWMGNNCMAVYRYIHVYIFYADLINQVQKDENNMEKMIKECMKEHTKSEDSMISTENAHKTLTAVACKAILRDEEQPSNAMTTSLALLFVDWLELLDPELVAMIPDLQQQLLFAREKLQGTPRQSVVHSSQPYLLTLLTHQSSWASLRRCVNCLLQPAEVSRSVPFPCTCMFTELLLPLLYQ